MKSILLLLAIVTATLTYNIAKPFVPLNTSFQYKVGPYCVKVPAGSLIIGSHDYKCVQKKFFFEGGVAKIFFQFIYRRRDTFTPQIELLLPKLIPNLEILIDGRHFRNLTQNCQKIEIAQQLSKGTHTISFCPREGKEKSDAQFIYSITTPQIRATHCSNPYGQNLIRNGDFEANDCNKITKCFQTNQQPHSERMEGWYPMPEIHIWNVNVTNNYKVVPRLGYVAVLGIKSNQICIEQAVFVTNGRVKIDVTWAGMVALGKNNVKIVPTPFDIRIGGQIVKSITPTNAQVHNDTFFLNATVKGFVNLEFCGKRGSNQRGAFVDNVKFYNYEGCPSKPYLKSELLFHDLLTCFIFNSSFNLIQPFNLSTNEHEFSFLIQFYFKIQSSYELSSFVFNNIILNFHCSKTSQGQISIVLKIT